jgi:DNA-binding response OmpR family regulator
MPDPLLRVLVVDDNHDNADIVRQYLESTHEYVVAVAYDGDEALRQFRDTRPDLVLLDVMMPGLNGWEVCRVIKCDPAQAGRTRVIMVTARDDLADKRTALQTGADDFLEKPLDLSKLLATVRRNAATIARNPARQPGTATSAGATDSGSRADRADRADRVDGASGVTPA